jgi:hypothetical protein
MDSYIKDIDECLRLLDDDLVGTLDAKLREMRNTLYLEKLSFDQIKESARESSWIPPEYYMNDWVSDVCSFLKGNTDNTI